MKFVQSLLLAATLARTPAIAGPPKDYYGPLGKPYLFCRYKEDLKRLIDTQQTDARESRELYSLYSKDILRNKRPRCEYCWVGRVYVGGNVDLGVIADQNGMYSHVWLVNIGNFKIEGWIFYTESSLEKGA